MGELRADWRLRLRRDDAHGPICGAGVLVDQYTALTCAHVVRRPDAVMWLEFAENGDLEPVSARVPPGGWLPAGEGVGEAGAPGVPGAVRMSPYCGWTVRGRRRGPPGWSPRCGAGWRCPPPGTRRASTTA